MAEERRHSSHHHHHHHHGYNVHGSPSRFRWKRDKKMIIGVIVIAVACVVLAFGPGRPFLKEVTLLFRAWVTPETDDPGPEVDPLKINYKLAKDRQKTGDSIAAVLNLDTMRRDIRQESVPVYRPPIKKDNWYLSSKDVKELRRGAENKENE